MVFDRAQSRLEVGAGLHGWNGARDLLHDLDEPAIDCPKSLDGVLPDRREAVSCERRELPELCVGLIDSGTESVELPSHLGAEGVEFPPGLGAEGVEFRIEVVTD